VSKTVVIKQYSQYSVKLKIFSFGSGPRIGISG
jgi:hypothetical protein